ncbi:MAG TPA: hypothetical protein VGM32_03390 [Rhodopila sp.]
MPDEVAVIAFRTSFNCLLRLALWAPHRLAHRDTHLIRANALLRVDHRGKRRVHATELPAGADTHEAILVTVGYFARVVSRCDVDVVALIFEGSVRGDKLVKRDYNLSCMELENMWARQVEVEGCFMPQTFIEPGLEVADLIAHMAGRQPVMTKYLPSWL